MLYVKALHIISVVCWFAVLFYLPRLFVYHTQTNSAEVKEQFKIMERRLYRGIGHPSMIATLVFGLWTASYAWEYNLSSTWFHIKMTLVVLLLGYHHVCGRFLRQLRDECCSKNQQFFRWFNEFPTLILVAAVFLAVLKRPL